MIELLILEHEIAMIHYLFVVVYSKKNKILLCCKVVSFCRNFVLSFRNIYNLLSSIQIDLLQIFMIITYKQIGK